MAGRAIFIPSCIQNLLEVPLTETGGSRLEPLSVEETGVDAERWFARDGCCCPASGGCRTVRSMLDTRPLLAEPLISGLRSRVPNFA